MKTSQIPTMSEPASDKPLAGDWLTPASVWVPAILYVDILAMGIKKGWDREVLKALEPRDPVWFPTPYGASFRYILLLAGLWLLLDFLWPIIRKRSPAGAGVRTGWLMVGMLVLLASQGIVPGAWNWWLTPDLLAAPSSLPRVLVALFVVYFGISLIYSGVRHLSSDNQS